MTGDAHWGMHNQPALCGALLGPNWTTVRYVTCHFCLNRLDRWLHDHMPEPATQSPKEKETPHDE